MRKLNIGDKKKRNYKVRTKKENMSDHIHSMYSNAKKCAAITQKKLEGKIMIPHPDMPKTYIYVDP